MTNIAIRWAIPVRSLLLAGALMALSGCVQEADRKRVSVNWGDLARGAASDYLYGVYVNRSRDAARRGDWNTSNEARGNAVKLALAALPREEQAERLYGEALTRDAAARTAERQIRPELVKQTAIMALEAVQLSPNFHSDDKETLNSLGYMLADRGSTQEQLATAVRLTAASLKIWNTEIAGMNGRPSTEQVAKRAVTAMDSYAWALTRSGKHVAALPIAERVIRDIRANLSPSNPRVDPSVLYHMGEIYRRNGRPAQARATLREALAQLNSMRQDQPDLETRDLINDALENLDKAPASPQSGPAEKSAT